MTPILFIVYMIFLFANINERWQGSWVSSKNFKSCSGDYHKTCPFVFFFQSYAPAIQAASGSPRDTVEERDKRKRTRSHLTDDAVGWSGSHCVTHTNAACIAYRVIMSASETFQVGQMNNYTILWSGQTIVTSLKSSFSDTNPQNLLFWGCFSTTGIPFKMAQPGFPLWYSLRSV